MATNFRELLVWQKAMALAEAAYATAKLLPDLERFGLAAQLRRSAISVPSNIAEGHERRSRADYRTFVAIACGSLAELESQLELCRRLYRIDGEGLKIAQSLADETGRLLRSIERALRDSQVREAAEQYDSPQPSTLSPQPS